MSELIFVTSNPHKVEEVKKIIANQYVLKGLKDLNFSEEIPETSNTIPGNAVQKATFIHDRFRQNCFAEDTGLEVDFLNGAPGVDTAMYAGPQRNANENMELLLHNLKNSDRREAQFRTVIALYLENQLHCFEGIVKGKIAKKKTGNGGFGYDPIFIPNGYNLSFAELDSEIKNKISHRGRAVNKLLAFLSNYNWTKNN